MKTSKGYFGNHIVNHDNYYHYYACYSQNYNDDKDDH